MPLVEVVTIEVGAAIAKSILKLWLKDTSLGGDIASSVIDLLKLKTSDKLAQRKGNRQFEVIGERVGESLFPFFEREGVNLDQEERTAVAYSIAETFNQSVLSSEVLVKNNLEPKQLANYIFTAYPSTTLGFSEAANQLYQRVINEACTCIVDIASQLPSFTEQSFAEILKQEDLIIEKADQILSELRKMREQLDPMIEAERFEIEYRQSVARNLDILQLIGATVALANRRHKLSVAYITLSVEQKRPLVPNEQVTEIVSAEDEVGKDIVSVNVALASSNRLLIQGTPGSGKTTLLQWIAVRAATKTFEGELARWNTYLPFYIRLRHYVQSDLPRPEAFPFFVAPAIADTMPKGWVHTILKSGRALVLIDGVDELPAFQREEIHIWLSDLVAAFPMTRFIVTSRPYAIPEGWMNIHSFDKAELQSLELPDMFTFIDHWHNAVREEIQTNEEKLELPVLADHLKLQVRQNHALRILATSPLLCAMLCALNRERRRQLPVNRVELYKACCSLLLERRDKESRIDLSDYPSLTLIQKERVLQDLAYWMIQEHLSEADVTLVDRHIVQQLVHMPSLPLNTSSSEVRLLLVERSGLIQESTAGQIAFVHRTFEEFFAAQAALDAADVEKLIANAHDDQWQEVIILASGLASKALCEQLITGLIERGDKERGYRHQLHLLAVSCLETAIQLKVEIKEAVEQRLWQLVPPINMSEAKAIAAAGELAVKHLVKKGNPYASTSAACIRALALIGGDAALSTIESYNTDKRETVIKELLKTWNYFDSEIYLRRILQKTLHLSLGDLTVSHEFNHYEHLKELDLSGSELLSDLTPLAQLTNLTHLNLSGCHAIRSLTPLIHLTNLTQLDLSKSNTLTDLEPLAHLTNLTHLNLSQCHKITDLAPLAQLTNLTYLNLSKCSGITDLIPLVNLTHLDTLDLSDFWRRIDFSLLSKLTNLKKLNLSKCEQLTDLTLLNQLTKLTKLNLSGCHELSDLAPLACLTNLVELNLSGYQGTDFTP